MPRPAKRFAACPSSGTIAFHARSQVSCGEHPARPRGGERRSRNRSLLEAYAASRDPQDRLRLRNAVVADNMPLVFSLAGRMSQGCQIPFDDLAQVGSLGLIRAVENYDPARSTCLSTLAVKYIRGAMRHEVRDRQALMRIPRTVWEMQQRLASKEEEHRRDGATTLSDEELALCLGCDGDVLRQARRLPEVTSMQSLDAPLGGGADAGCLLDQLQAAAHPGGQDGVDPFDGDPEAGPELLWLRQRMQGLDGASQILLRGRFQLGCTWVELGRELGIPPRQAQRRCLALQDRLRQEAAAWGGITLQEGGSPSGIQPMATSPIASRAASRV